MNLILSSWAVAGFLSSLQNLGLLGVGLVVILFLGALIAATKLYRRATKETSLVKTGFGGQKVVMNSGTFVVPVLHEVIKVNMNTLRLEVRRSGESGLITKDRMRVDVQAEFFVRVKPTVDAIANAAQTLGIRTMDPSRLKELVEGKFVDSLRAVAAEMTMEELHEQRVQFVQRVQTTVSEDILKNGLELESVALTSLDQTPMEYFNPNNAFDAQGLAKLTETIEAKRKERNDIEQETRVLIEQKNLHAEQQSLQIRREQEFARLEQDREIQTRRAQQSAEIAKEQADREREAKQAEILAKQHVDQSRIASERQVQEAQIQTDREIREFEVLKERTVEQAEIERKKTVEQSDIDRQRAVELAEQDRAIAVAEKSRAKSEAEAEAARARALAVKADEEVITVREREIAERRKVIELVQASEIAERDAIKITVAAEAEKKASEDRAAAARIIAEAEADKVRIAAIGEAEATRVRAEAKSKEYEVDAVGKRAINEAENVISDNVLAAQIKKVLIANLPNIIRESVKPMEQIDGIKIIHVEGLGGGNGHMAGIAGADGVGSPASGSLADQLVNSALRYRGQAPLVDALMQEIGLSGNDINGLTRGLGDAPRPIPPAPEAP
jgi:uncharacterized membrane protein YqiK